MALTLVQALPPGAAIGVILSAALMLPTTVVLSVEPSQSVAELQAAYSKGDFEAVRRQLATVLDTPASIMSFKRSLDKEVSRTAPHLGAAFALEASAAAILDGVQHPDTSTQIAILDLIEAGCRRLRSSRDTAPTFERQWYLAVMALLAGPGSSLLGGVERPTWFWGGAVWLHAHNLDAHARKRFPQDPEIAFNWALSRELEVHVFMQSAGVGQQRPGIAIPSRERQQHQFLREAALGFEEARQDARLRAPATLRLGRVRALQGRAEEALRLWIDAEASTDDLSLKYLALLFRGITLSELKRWPEATVEFQRASEAQPAAQAARLATAAFAYLANNHDDAARQVELLLKSRPMNQDPWASYLAPGYSDWPKRLLALREAVRPRQQ